MNLRHILRLLRRGLIVRLKIASRSRYQIASVMFMPLIQATSATYVFKAGSHPANLLYAAIGAGYVAMWATIVFDGGASINRERWDGTLELLVCSPAPFLTALAGITMASAIASGYGMALTLLWGTVVLGIPLHIASPVLFVASFAVGIGALAALGLVFATAFTLSRETIAIALALETPAWLLCGLFLPVSILPVWTRPVSDVLAPTWGVEALRRAADGRPVGVELAACAGLIVVYVLLAGLMMQRVEHRARVDASLALA